MEEDLSVQIDNHRTLWLTEISRSTYEDQGLDALGSDCGLFLVLEDENEARFDVLAKAPSPSAGEALLELVAQSLTGRPRLSIVR
jgi:hypothetical protein